jgi:hypothetical protein
MRFTSSRFYNPSFPLSPRIFRRLRGNLPVFKKHLPTSACPPILILVYFLIIGYLEGLSE